MNKGNSPHTLISQQQAQIGSWHDEADEIGENIADEILDRLEIEPEDLTKDRLLWDIAPIIQTALLSSLAPNFNEVCEKWITRRLDTLSETTCTAIGPAREFDTPSASIDNLRKDMRIRQHLRPHIKKVFENAKPWLFRTINRALKNDIDYVLEEMEKDAEADVRKLCQCFHAARLNMAPETAAISSKPLRTVLRSYLIALQDTANHLVANQTAPAEATWNAPSPAQHPAVGRLAQERRPSKPPNTLSKAAPTPRSGSDCKSPAPQRGHLSIMAAKSAGERASLRGDITSPRQLQAEQCWRNGDGAMGMACFPARI